MFAEEVFNSEVFSNQKFLLSYAAFGKFWRDDLLHHCVHLDGFICNLKMASLFQHIVEQIEQQVKPQLYYVNILMQPMYFFFAPYIHVFSGNWEKI